MSIITLFSATHCQEETVTQDLIASTGFQIINDDQLAAEAGKFSGLGTDRIKRAFSAKTSVFNKFTHEKECSIAHLKLALAKKIAAENLIVNGFSGFLIPQEISHTLRICLVADMKYRIARKTAASKISKREAAGRLRKEDKRRSAWTTFLFNTKDPWDENFFDVVIPMHKTVPHKAGAIIKENLIKDILRPTIQSRQAAANFLLAATVEVALLDAGHDVTAVANEGAVTLTINKQVMLLGRLEEELKSIAGKINGVTQVNTEVSKNYHLSNIYRKHDFEAPSRVLLVDDERDFVQTLSERLELRDMGSAVVYDGNSALDIVKEDDPEVIIIDLKMPGKSGIEVLREVKAIRPEIEVIVLTGHGCEKDRQLCMQLGAFAYMQKPVDIEVLSKTLEKAHAKIIIGRDGN